MSSSAQQSASDVQRQANAKLNEYVTKIDNELFGNEILKINKQVFSSDSKRAMFKLQVGGIIAGSFFVIMIFSGIFGALFGAAVASHPYTFGATTCLAWVVARSLADDSRLAIPGFAAALFLTAVTWTQFASAEGMLASTAELLAYAGAGIAFLAEGAAVRFGNIKPDLAKRLGVAVFGFVVCLAAVLVSAGCASSKRCSPGFNMLSTGLKAIAWGVFSWRTYEQVIVRNVTATDKFRPEKAARAATFYFTQIGATGMKLANRLANIISQKTAQVASQVVDSATAKRD